MNHVSARNSTIVLIDVLAYVLEHGDPISPREQSTKELLSVFTSIEKPLERCYILPKRNNNIFAQIAETLWVLAGRNDMDFLSHYLPRAPDYSDDGKVWRGGYGPRLRKWHGISGGGYADYVDQLSAIVRLLNNSPDTRRAVMMIFDPAKDNTISKDIPCNDLIQFIIRDNKLYMNVYVRSQDILWGFSGINTFEWSILHEFMAYWTSTEVGTYTQFAGSFHLYERHYKRAKSIVDNFPGKTVYDIGAPRMKFSTSFFDGTFDNSMDRWFRHEKLIRSYTSESEISEYIYMIDRINDEFLNIALHMMAIWNLLTRHAPANIVKRVINAMPYCDWKVAAIEYVCRDAKRYELDTFDIPPEIIAFLRQF